MIKSMTGYGKGSINIDAQSITCEIKTLNSRYFDIIFRIPSEYKEKEMEIKSLISETLIRGKVELTIKKEATSEESASQINHELVKSYYKQLNTLADELKASKEGLINICMGLPEVLEKPKEELSEEEWNQVKKLLNDACKRVDESRLREGDQLATDFLLRVKNITGNLEKIETLDAERKENMKKKLREQLRSAAVENVDENRFEQELIYYLEKLDITEEKVRLNSHCEYFVKTMEEENSGKKLGFIAQEMGREINTIGAKANHAEIQRLVVLMKDELEKIKEQVMNVV